MLLDKIIQITIVLFQSVPVDGLEGGVGVFIFWEVEHGLAPGAAAVTANGCL